MKYRKKPVIIEAFKYEGYLIGCIPQAPPWAIQAWREGTLYYSKDGEKLFVKTLEGDHLVTIGDYIIKGVKDELYACKPDIFEMTYEKVED